MSNDLTQILDLPDDGARAGTAGECTPPCDVVETAGELRLVLPRIQDRRGGEIRIAVQAD